MKKLISLYLALALLLGAAVVPAMAESYDYTIGMLSYLNMTEEEKAILDESERPDQETKDRLDARDMPAGTIITQPYFSDYPVMVVLKQTPEPDPCKAARSGSQPRSPGPACFGLLRLDNRIST